jgi:hypothetical protein
MFAVAARRRRARVAITRRVRRRDIGPAQVLRTREYVRQPWLDRGGAGDCFSAGRNQCTDELPGCRNGYFLAADGAHGGFEDAANACFDHPHCPGYGVGCSTPEREVGGCLAATAQAGTKSGFLRGSDRDDEATEFWSGHWGRAKWPAVDSGCRDGDEQPPVETVVSGFYGAVTGGSVHVHARMMPDADADGSRFSDLIGGAIIEPKRGADGAIEANE